MNAVLIRNLKTGKCERCPVHNLGLCSVISQPALDELGQISHMHNYAAGETILAEGEPIEMVGNVVDGVVRISKTLPDGRVQIVGLLMPSDFFARAYTEAAPFLFEAATEVTLCLMPRRAFEAVVARHTDLEHALLVSTLDELDATREWTVILGVKSTIERLASYLVALYLRSHAQGCRRVDPPDPNFVEIPVRRRDLAAYLGTTVETISRNVQELARRGVIRIHTSSRFAIVDEEALFALSGHEERNLREAREMIVERRLSA